MGKKSSPPKAPDLTGITNAQLKIAEDSNDLAREFLGLSREQYAYMQQNAQEELDLARTQADRLFEYQQKAFDSDEQARQFAQQVGQTQMDAMNLQMDYAKKDRERYESVAIPLQDQYIKEAQAYDTPERRAAEAARATADVQRQAEAARANSDQRLRSMGIDPSQMRSQTLLDTQNVALAAQQAGAANQARTAVEDRGRAMRADALNVLSGLPAQSLAGYASATNSGNAAVGAGAAGQAAQLAAIQGGANVGGTAMGFRSSALNNLANLTGSPTQWAGMGSNALGQASSAYGNAANTASQGFQNQMASWQAGQQQAQQGFQNIMSVASLAGGMMMAEGGHVTRRRALNFAEGGDVQREKFPMASALIDMPSMGPAKGGKSFTSEVAGPTMDQRFASGMAAQGQYDPGNVYDSAPLTQPLMTRQTALGGDATRYAAEGGRALPVKQVRDKIPAYLAEGEYIVPADVVRAKGIEFFDKLTQKYHRANA